MTLTFLDQYAQLSIPELLDKFGMKMELYAREDLRYPTYITSFFENRNPYAVVSVGVFFGVLPT